MANHKLFFHIVTAPLGENNEERALVLAGRTSKMKEHTGIYGDIQIDILPEMLGRRGVAGFLIRPKRAEIRFDGTIEEMEALWFATGTQRAFLRDSRFRIVRA